METDMQVKANHPLYDGVGYVKFTHCGGKEEEIIKSARMSTQKGFQGWDQDKKLLKYLWDNKHATPFEFCTLSVQIKAPIFVARQVFRHRTFCLAADSELEFDLPGFEHRIHRIRIDKVYEAMQITGNPLLDCRMERLMNMRLRALNTDTHTPIHTNIVDCWFSGMKEVFMITLANGKHLKMSKDHLCYTDNGWKKLCDINIAIDKIATVARVAENILKQEFPETDVSNESWKPVVGWETYYEVSNYGNVRRVKMGGGVRGDGYKKNTINTVGYSVVSLSRNSKTTVHSVHKLVIEAFKGKRLDKYNQEVRHLNGNKLDNRVDNLEWGTPSENANDRILHKTMARLGCKFVSISSCVSVGEEPTYDVEVSSEYHNFSANGFVVHNSFNELSGRYSELPESFYMPKLKYQDTKNKQGSDGYLSDEEANPIVLECIEHHKKAFALYRTMLQAGVSREQARIVLPVSIMTEWRMCGNLRNWMHFLSLRLDSHAQQETRELAKGIASILKPLYPNTWEVSGYQTLYDTGTLNPLTRVNHSPQNPRTSNPGVFCFVWHNRNMKLKDVDFTLQIKKPESSYRDLIEELEKAIDRLKFLEAQQLSSFKGVRGDGVSFDLKSK